MKLSTDQQLALAKAAYHDAYSVHYEPGEYWPTPSFAPTASDTVIPECICVQFKGNGRNTTMQFEISAPETRERLCRVLKISMEWNPNISRWNVYNGRGFAEFCDADEEINEAIINCALVILGEGE